MSNALPEVSVVMSTYNGERYVRESIESVLRQSNHRFELLITDDCSEDDTRRILRSFDDERIKLFCNDRNLGLFANLDTMIQSSRAPLIKLWSQDDLMLENCLGAGLKFHFEHPNLGCYWCDGDTIDASGRLVSRSLPDETPCELTCEVANVYSLHHGCLSSNISNLFLPKEKYQEVGGFRADYISADFDYIVRTHGQHPIGRLPKTLVQIRQHEDQWSRAATSLVRFLGEDIEIHKILIHRVTVTDHSMSKREAYEIIYRKFGINYMHPLVKYLMKGNVTKAMQIATPLLQFLPVPSLLMYWMRHLPKRISKRILLPMFGRGSVD